MLLKLLITEELPVFSATSASSVIDTDYHKDNVADTTKVSATTVTPILLRVIKRLFAMMKKPFCDEEIGLLDLLTLSFYGLSQPMFTIL